MSKKLAPIIEDILAFLGCILFVGSFIFALAVLNQI